MKIAVLPGDGIGTEIVAEAVKVLNVLGLPIEMETALFAGADELLDEIHPAAGFDPAVVSVDVVGFEQHLELQEDRAVECQVAKRGDSRGGFTSWSRMISGIAGPC